MRWRGRRQSSNIENRRGRGASRGFGLGNPGRIRIPLGGRAGRGGGGLTGIIILVVIFIVLRFMGIDPLALLSEAPDQAPQTSTSSGANQATDEETRFIATVLADTEDTWNAIFASEGQTYREPVLVLFSDSAQSACGYASSAVGPFYCPRDSKLYLDTSFFRALSQKFGAGGDFAQAYVIAHEVGHHVQNLIGVLPKFNEMRQAMSEVEANRMSVRVELQADCFAGIWAHSAAQKGYLETGDIDEALNAANQIGDDTLQQRSKGYVVPDSFNHGTSEQRKTWFMRGLENGSIEDCDTFNNPV